jgi:hypothetical protein
MVYLGWELLGASKFVSRRAFRNKFGAFYFPKGFSVKKLERLNWCGFGMFGKYKGDCLVCILFLTYICAYSD